MKETLEATEEISFINFISHMVQMKASLSSNSFSPQSSLYPTWFRWKVKKGKNSNEKISLYIPHGSDERDNLAKAIKDALNFISHMVQMKVREAPQKRPTPEKPLYPTWFRWKISTAISGVLVAFVFISHMVQMKEPITIFI